MTKITNPTGRKTQAHTVTLDNGILMYFSYETLIAVHDPNQGFKARLPNRWGPTTGRHFKELGCANFPIVEEMPIIRGTLDWSAVFAGEEGV